MEEGVMISRRIGFVLMMIACCSTVSAITSVSLDEVRREIAEQGLDWTASDTSISKLTDDEFHAMLNLKLPADYVEPTEETGLDADPFNGRAQWDWREHNGVTGVRHQGNCGSCWAFATVAIVESYILIYDGYNWDLSEQQLVSCNSEGYGCDGGWFLPDMFMSPGGIYESCMPYQASDTVPCTQNQCQKVAFIEDYQDISSSVTSIKNALVDGPVAVAMYARDNFSYYSGGCYSGGSSSSVNHGVLIVGYNDSECSGQGAWIVKNSWGTGWGDNGFFMIKYGDSNIGYGAQRIFYTPQGSVNLVYGSNSISDVSQGNGNGQADSGETVQILVTLGNTGSVNATGVAASLACTNSSVLIPDNFATFADIPASQQRQSNSPHFTVSIPSSVSGGSVLTFNLSITSNQGAFSGSFNLTVGSTPMPTWTPPPPTATPQPTNTSIPSWTPGPTSTPQQTSPPGATNTPAPTFTPQSSPIPSRTPESTEPPEATATRTPMPGSLIVILRLNQHEFTGGDRFLLTFETRNTLESILTEQYIVLAIGGSYWFWPDWTQTTNSTLAVVEAGDRESTILDFVWPAGAGQFDNIQFLGVLCEPGTFNPVSNLATTAFSFR